MIEYDIFMGLIVAAGALAIGFGIGKWTRRKETSAAGGASFGPIKVDTIKPNRLAFVFLATVALLSALHILPDGSHDAAVTAYFMLIKDVVAGLDGRPSE